MGKFTLGAFYATRGDTGYAAMSDADSNWRNPTGVPAGFRLAPVVDWKSSIIGVEDDAKNTEGIDS